MAAAVFIHVAFPRAAYRGSDLGDPEPIPSPARVQTAFLAAAAGGPSARVDRSTVVAEGADQRAVLWMEENEPLGVRIPEYRLNEYSSRRYRVRVAVNTKTRSYQNEDTPFEPLVALAGPVTYAWPAPEPEILEAFRRLAREVTHVGRADSLAIVTVELSELDAEDPDWLHLTSGRGPGLALRVPTPGRLRLLVEEFDRISKPGGHGTGTKDKQARDVLPVLIGDEGTSTRRFAPRAPTSGWPFDEVVELAPDRSLPHWVVTPARRIAAAVAIHRALVASIRSDVPPFISGRDGDGPRRGAGHLAIHLVQHGQDEEPRPLLAVPRDAGEADRATLLSALESGLLVRIGRYPVRLAVRRLSPALPYWPRSSRVMTTDGPMVLDAPGSPRRGNWTLEDAVICSVGYAMRGVLEEDGLEWRTGWAFRQELVAHLRGRGVDARAGRVFRDASRFVHRAREGDLLVAVHAAVDLGELAGPGGGFLALGRARHLGGGFLRPLVAVP